jgi:hypothetical protein
VTLVERLREFEGESGSYAWTVTVWRSDTRAVANLRVRLKVYRIRRHSFLWFEWTSREQVYQETEVASDASVDDHVTDLREQAEAVADRFESERQTVAEATV